MKTVSRLFQAGAVFSLTLMILIVGIQVFARYFLQSSPSWTEEAARIMFIYGVAFGTGTGIRNGDFIRLDLIDKYLPPRKRWWLDVFTDVIIIVFGVILLAGSVQFIRLGVDELSPALEISMGFVFISMSVIGIAIILFTLMHLRQLILKI